MRRKKVTIFSFLNGMNATTSPKMDQLEGPVNLSKILQKETATDEEYHELYLQTGSVDYITSVSFEDGMDWHECELYYACISNGMMEHRSAFHMKRATQYRRPSKKQLLQQVGGQLQSCLRTSNKSKPLSTFPEMRRSISFNTLPNISAAYSQNISDSLREIPSRGPRVHFDDYVSVSTVFPIEAYPSDIRKNLWMSRSEIDACMHSAMKEHALRRAHNQSRVCQSNFKTEEANRLSHDVSLILEVEKRGDCTTVTTFGTSLSQ